MTPSNCESKRSKIELTLTIRKALISKGILDSVSNITVSDSGLKGENLGSDTEYITVNFEDEKIQPLNLFLKQRTNNEEHNKMIDEFQLFEKESEFFTKYLEKAEMFCKSKGKEDLMRIYPKCYFSDNEQFIFENLVVGRNFHMLDKMAKQDFKAASVALATLAKHHAISHALIKEHGKPLDSFFEDFSSLKLYAFHGAGRIKKLFEPSFENQIDISIRILEKSNPFGKNEAMKKLRSLKGKSLDDFLSALEMESDELLILGHGDYWNNNMMFGTDVESGEIVDHVPIDFQTVWHCSPVLDLSYFLMTSVKPSVRRSQFRSLIEVYLDNLNSTAKDLGHPINLSFGDMQKLYSKHSLYGFWLGIMVNVGGGYAILKDLDITDMSDIEKWTETVNKLTQKWVEEHPEDCQKNAEDLVEYIGEYDKCKSGEMFL